MGRIHRGSAPTLWPRRSPAARGTRAYRISVNLRLRESFPVLNLQR